MNRTADFEFTIIVPIYNEEENLSRLEETLTNYLQRASLRTCVILVDDASTDGSLKGIQRICEHHSDIVMEAPLHLAYFILKYCEFIVVTLQLHNQNIMI